MHEIEIIRRCKEYDKSAFKELVSIYSPLLMSICTRYMGDKHYAEDMLQESYIKIFKNIMTYQDIGPFKSWLAKITVNTCLQEIRKKNVIIDTDIKDIEEVGGADYIMINDEIGIMKIIEELKMPHKVVFNLYVIEGYSHLEISELLGITEATSRTHLSRARKMIQELLIKYNIQLTA
jgi:RNA polymerase sigma factor (sigma-70 family)